MDCLVTKLKASVNDSSLKKLGVLRLSVNTPVGASGNRLVIQGNAMTLKCSSPGYFTNSGNSYDPSGNLGTEISSPFIGYSVNGEYDIEISPKYNIANSFNAGAAGVDLSDLMTSPSLTSLTAVNARGNIISLINTIAGLSTIVVEGAGVIGDLSDLTRFTFSRLSLANSDVTGAIESVGEGLYGTLADGDSIRGDFPSRTTLHGEPVSGSAFLLYFRKSNGVLRLTNSSDTHTFASYNGSVWTY